MSHHRNVILDKLLSTVLLQAQRLSIQWFIETPVTYWRCSGEATVQPQQLLQYRKYTVLYTWHASQSFGHTYSWKGFLLCLFFLMIFYYFGIIMKHYEITCRVLCTNQEKWWIKAIHKLTIWFNPMQFDIHSIGMSYEIYI